MVDFRMLSFKGRLLKAREDREREERIKVDPFIVLIDKLKGRNEVTTQECLVLLEAPADSPSYRRVAKLLYADGWEQARLSPDGPDSEKIRGWRRIGSKPPPTRPVIRYKKVRTKIPMGDPL